jgi:membrane protein DedA with SNARE-associated domain
MDLPELLEWIARYDRWVYGLLLAYGIAKTGPLPMIAGFAAAQGALRVELLLLATLLGSVAGGQARFALGRLCAPWVCRTFTGLAPWLALSSAGVERYRLRVLLAYRFVKGSFSLVGLGAGASLLGWARFTLIDAAGALLWVCTMIGIGWGLGYLGMSVDPRWAAYVGLTLLGVSVVALTVLSKQLKQRLYPLAQAILEHRTASRNRMEVAARTG